MPIPGFERNTDDADHSAKCGKTTHAAVTVTDATQLLRVGALGGHIETCQFFQLRMCLLNSILQIKRMVEVMELFIVEMRYEVTAPRIIAIARAGP